jgi:hypothetical protein
MAAPNLIGATTITGTTTGVSLTTTAATAVLNNASGSGKCLKVNTLNVANYGTSSASITIGYYNAAAVGGTLFQIVGNVIVPANSTLNVIDKSSQYYLAENSSLGATAGLANTLCVTCSYEDIS